jgi:mono/diheme cytochrome c family protein
MPSDAHSGSIQSRTRTLGTRFRTNGIRDARPVESSARIKERTMNCKFRALALLCSLAASAGALSAPSAALLDRYAAEARAADPAFAGFSAARGEALHRTRHGLGKPDTPACTACHGENARASGQTRSGKTIEPMAVSVTATRYTDPAKVEKWFKRNCAEVLGRECSAREKGDWLAWMTTQ